MRRRRPTIDVEGTSIVTINQKKSEKVLYMIVSLQDCYKVLLVILSLDGRLWSLECALHQLLIPLYSRLRPEIGSVTPTPPSRQPADGGLFTQRNTSPTARRKCYHGSFEQRNALLACKSRAAQRETRCGGVHRQHTRYVQNTQASTQSLAWRSRQTVRVQLPDEI